MSAPKISCGLLGDGHLPETHADGLIRELFSCNFHGNEAWTLALPWSGHDHFSHEPLRPWYASEEAAKAQNTSRAGEYRQYGRLAFAGVDGAGHFVPYDKPEEALALVNRWIFDRKVGYA